MQRREILKALVPLAGCMFRHKGREVAQTVKIPNKPGDRYVIFARLGCVDIDELATGALGSIECLRGAPIVGVHDMDDIKILRISNEPEAEQKAPQERSTTSGT